MGVENPGDTREQESLLSPQINTPNEVTLSESGTLPAAREERGFAKNPTSLAFLQKLLGLLTKLFPNNGG